MLIAISISPTILHRKRVAGAAVDAAAAVDAVGVAEEAVPRVFGRVEAERACLGAESAFDACVRDANGGASWVDRLVYLPHRANGTPERTVEDEPPDESDRRRDGDHGVEEESPGAHRRRLHPEVKPRHHRHHDEERRFLRKQFRRDLAPGVGQQRIERASRTEVAAPVPSAMPERPDKPHRHVQEKAVGKIRVFPSKRQDDYERQRLDPFLVFPRHDHDSLSTVTGTAPYSLRLQKLKA